MTHSPSFAVVPLCDRARSRPRRRLRSGSSLSVAGADKRDNLIVWGRCGAALRTFSTLIVSCLGSLGCETTLSTADRSRRLPDVHVHRPTDMEGRDGGGAHLAVVAGIFATAGSLLGKLAGGADASSLSSLVLKGALLVFMIVCNTVGCTFFVKALHASGSSLPITVASAATTYVCSAFVGSIVFDESTSLIWWCGTSLVLLGLMLICNVPAEKKASAVEEKLKHQ